MRKDLDKGRGFKGGEKKILQHYFLPGQLDIILRHAEQLKTDTSVKKARRSLGPSHPACLSTTNSPRFHTPLTPWSTPLPQAGMKTSREPAKHSEAAAEGEKVHCRAQHLCLAAAKQAPCVHAAVAWSQWKIAMEDDTEGPKERSATGAECQVARWALGQSRPIYWVKLGGTACLGELPHRAFM